MTRDQALSKIKKCLALAQSGNAHEAAAGMRQAQKLMAEHELGELDVTLSQVGEGKTDVRSSYKNLWEVQLVNLVAESFGCFHFFQQYYRPDSSLKCRNVFIGEALRQRWRNTHMRCFPASCGKTVQPTLKSSQAAASRLPRRHAEMSSRAAGYLESKGWLNGLLAKKKTSF